MEKLISLPKEIYMFRLASLYEFFCEALNRLLWVQVAAMGAMGEERPLGTATCTKAGSHIGLGANRSWRVGVAISVRAA